MIFKFLLFIVCLTSFFKIKAQDLPKYTVDLENEMHYKVKASNWKERGIKEFKEDIQVHLKNLELKVKWINVFFELNIDNNGKPSLGLFGTSDTFAQDALEVEIKESILKLIKNFKSARYNGNVIAGSYLIRFTMNFNNNMLSIYNVDFESTLRTANVVNNLNCLKVYSNNDNDVPPKHVFTAAEIEPEYADGFNYLCFRINRGLISKYEEAKREVEIQCDSIDVSLLIAKNSKLWIEEKFLSSNPADAEIFKLLKTYSCGWKPAVTSGRLLDFNLRLRFIYHYVYNDDLQIKNIVNIRKILKLKSVNAHFN